MKRGRRSKYVVLLISLVLIFSLTGCKASKKKVLESSYYKELQKENKKLKKQNKSLKSKVDAENDMTEDEQRASDYLEKISRDHLVKLEVGYADNMDGSEFIEEEAVFSLATIIASRADKTTKYTPDEVKEKYGPGYEYILYDEDNAIYEIMVYGGNYIVFTNASIIGKGNFVEKNIGLGVSAVAMENPTASVAGEYWLDGEKVDAPAA